MNDFKTLLVHLDATPAARRLAVARRLARDHGAQVEVLYAVLPLGMQYPLSLAADGGAAAQLASLEIDARAAARAAFERDRVAAGLADTPWAQTDDEPVRGFKRRAWAADLLLLAQHEPAARAPSGVPADFAASVLMETGKPGLVLPYIEGPADLGQEVLVAWKSRPESARALGAALPILQRARRVHVAAWDESADGGPDTVQPALQFLQRHGVVAIAHREGPPARDLGENLLSLAADLQADLLVMGCYGHGRAREWALGGVTRTILQSMTLPVLMVH